MPTGDEGLTIVHGWGLRGLATHERHSWPEGEIDRVEADHGRFATSLNREVAGHPLLERVRLRTLERMTARRADILIDLMQRHPWELCGTTFFESHWAGHDFHQYVKRDAYLERVPRGRGLQNALLRVYQAVDTAIGRIIDAAPPGTHVAVVSGMGLRPNTNGLTLLPRALEALGYTVPAEASGATRRREALRRLALTAVPRPLARAVKRKLLDPETVDRHMERMWTESTDWSRTRAWAEAEQGSGWVRLNVAGREPEGIVRPGREYDDLCAQIAADLLELREVRSGLPAIDEVVHRSELTTGQSEELLPDLMIKWSDRAVVRRAHHPRVGLVEDDGTDWQVTEHDDDGWLVLNGPRVAAGTRGGDARVEDLAPTLIHLMGGRLPRHVDGRVLGELLEAGEAAA
jgi:predicted AlkP superfamily phosphohydrolase/phosphomutase